MIGIILAGGKGTRLHPLTLIQSKQLLPVYDKPMIYYPLSTLMDAGIKKFIIISSSEYIEQYKKLFQNGNSLGIKINYLVQKSPDGIAQAFLISKKYITNQNVCLILGDNVFYGQAINVGTNSNFSVEEIVKKIAIKLKKINYKIIKEAKRFRPEKSEVDNLLCDNSYLINNSRWKQKVNFSDGLDKTIEWLKKYKDLNNTDNYYV